MFYVYILKSRKDNKLYFGYTNNLIKRLKEHNLGLVRSTKSRIPLYCVYYEAYASKQDAVKREHNLKLRAKALRQLVERIKSSLKT
jgi:putative endonuclease